MYIYTHLKAYDIIVVINFFLFKPELIILLLLTVFLWHRCLSVLFALRSALAALMYPALLPQACVKIDQC